MANNSFIKYLLNPRNWWLPLLIIFCVSATGVFLIGKHTYTEAPPIASFVSKQRTAVFTNQDVLMGQTVFQKYALMEYGTMFGDGGYRGPDFTAEALHNISQYMNDYYIKQNNNDANAGLINQGIAQQVKDELKKNVYQSNTNSVALSDAQVYAANELVKYYTNKFTDASFAESMHPSKYITDSNELKSLTAFFFWGAWVCAVDRPGETYSYTHNWPYDPQSGNTPTAPIILWSIIGSLGLILGLGIVLYFHGKLEKLNDDMFTSKLESFMTKDDIKHFQPTAIQLATFKVQCL
ncbi:MAG TPA: hypothetical protein VHP12_07355, partial [Chitinophagaceae bacterium]|nr:hypothetical protein [Chitinophagaceae bacterium]